MSTKVFLHVGLPKSGTSYIQRTLVANKPRLRREAGLLFPGRRWHNQVLAVRDVREMGRRRASSGEWAKLVKEIAAWHGDAIVSMEWLCAATPEDVARIVADLAPAQVEVVFSVRDLGRTLPAAWQEFLQARQTWTWREFLDGVSAEDPQGTHAGRAFWSQQDLPTLLRRWTDVVGVEHAHLVTVPPPGAAFDVLWQRLCEVLGVPAADFEPAQLGQNESLGLESAELMRRLNPVSQAGGVSRNNYRLLFKHTLAKQALARRKDVESRLAIPEGYHDWTRRSADAQVEAIRASGVRVIGDLADLRPVLRDGVQPEDVPDSAVLDAGLAGLVALGVELNTTRHELEVAQRRITRLERRAAVAKAFEDRPLRAAVKLRLERARSR